MHKQPLLILCICFILGIFFQDYFLLNINFVYTLLISSFLSVLLYLINHFFFYQIRHVSLFILFFSLGIFAHSSHSNKPKLPKLNSKENIVFKINKKLNANQKNRRYEITAWKEKEPFLCVISVPKSEKKLDFLHYYKAEIYLNKIEKSYRDFQFDYAKYLSRKSIYFQAYLPNSFQAGKRNDLHFSEKIKQKRLETLNKIDDANFSKRTKEFTKGIILADRTEMDSETVQDFSKSGLMHILAISGSHMAVIFWLILAVLKPIFPPKLRNFKIIIGLTLIWIFAIFIDYGSSVVRSCIMISAYYIYILLQRKPDLLHAMAIAAFPILIFDTNQLFDAGFQLSFLAVFGIFWLNQPILKHLPKPKNDFQNFMVNIVSIGVSAQIATLPLVVYYFHQYSAISIIANFVIVPISEALIIFSLLMTILIGFSIHFTWLDFMYDAFVNFILKMIHVFANVDFAFFKMIPMNLLEVFVGFIIIWYLRFAVLKFKLKNIFKVIHFVLIFMALRFFLYFKAHQINEVLVHHYFKETIISVKQKDKIQFIMKESTNSEKIQKSIIEPYLTSKRVKYFEIKSIPDKVKEVDIDGKKYHLK